MPQPILGIGYSVYFLISCMENAGQEGHVQMSPASVHSSLYDSTAGLLTQSPLNTVGIPPLIYLMVCWGGAAADQMDF